MTRAEIDQGFYGQVMQANPSRAIDRSLPVESLSWSEASEFARRLSWILGMPVRLPTRAEFRAAAGEQAPTAEQVWSRETADGVPQRPGARDPNALGFHDLAGNVAEWLEEDEPGSASAWQGGGSVADPLETLVKLPMRRAAKTERSRFTGFRVVASLDVPPER
jgi:formylglycine-generating enzyme required for sulfatase activity